MLFVSGLRHSRFSHHLGFTMGMCPRHAAGLQSTSTRPSCRLQGLPSTPSRIARFQRSSLLRLRRLRHITTAAVLFTMCSPVRVLKPSQQPSNRFTTRFCSGPAVLCGLELDLLSERCNLLIEHLASDALMSCHAVTADMKASLSSHLSVVREFFDCANLSLDGLDCSLDAAVGAALSD